MQQRFNGELKNRSFTRSGGTHDGLVDLLTAGPGEPQTPDEVFARMHWGGVFVYVDSPLDKVQRLADSYNGKRGFIIEHRPTGLKTHFFSRR